MFYKVGIITTLILVFAFFFKKVEEANRRNAEIIKVQIKLINQCDLYDRAFMVKALPSGKVSKFKDKKAVMFLTRDSKVLLIASTEFPGFHFSNIPVSVSHNTELVADCSNSERLDNIFDSLKQQFNKENN